MKKKCTRFQIEDWRKEWVCMVLGCDLGSPVLPGVDDGGVVLVLERGPSKVDDSHINTTFISVMVS